MIKNIKEVPDDFKGMAVTPKGQYKEDWIFSGCEGILEEGIKNKSRGGEKMKGQYVSLVQLAEQIEEMEKEKQDFIAPTDKMRMIDDSVIAIEGVGKGYDINSYAHGQLASKLGIPKVYYDKMAKVPGLRTMNVNAWFHEEPKKMLVRMLSGNTARAFLSDRFKPIDNKLVMGALLPAIKEFNGGGEIQMNSSAITDRRFYLQLLFPTLKEEVKPNDPVCAGITIVNSEVGCSSFDVKTFIQVLKCSNGMVGESVFRRYHIGRRLGDDVMDYDFYGSDTIQAELTSLKLRLRDTLKHALTEAHFLEQVQKIRDADKTPIEGKVQDVVLNVTKKYDFSEKEGQLILDNIVKSGEPTKWGLSNGITALAHEIEDYDRQYEVEKIGAKIIDLSPKDWQVLQEAS